MSSYLVTGGAGFIGANLVEELLKKGEAVRVLDNLSTGKPENLSFVKNIRTPNIKYELVKADICDLDVCRKACRELLGYGNHVELVDGLRETIKYFGGVIPGGK